MIPFAILGAIGFLLPAQPRNHHGWNLCLLSEVVQTRFAPNETFGP
jgi:hypothetical protein